MLFACQSVPEPAPYRFASRCARRPVDRRSSRALCAAPVCVENPAAAACAGRFLRRRPCSARPCRPCTPNSPTTPSSLSSATSVPEAKDPLADEAEDAGKDEAQGELPDRATPTAPASPPADPRDQEDPRARFRRVAAQVQLLDSLNDWHAYDALAVEAATGTALEATVMQAGRLLGASGWAKRGGALQADEATVQTYVRKVAAGYASHAYHNSVHAAEVAFVVQYWLRHCPKLACSPLQQAALLLAAAVHDVGHRALTNDFLVQAGDPLAIRYNDRSVQEQYHAATAFELMRDGADVLAGLGAEDKKEARAVMVESVLATDMALHAKLLTEVEAADAGPVGAVDPRLLQKLILHAADIGHPLRPWRVHAAWSRRMMGEFFAQGDLDKQRGVSVLPMFDRDQCNAGSSQVGFINFVVAPTFNLLSRFLPRRVSRDHSDVLAQNTREWKALAEDEKRCAEFTAGIPARARDEAQAGLA